MGGARSKQNAETLKIEIGASPSGQDNKDEVRR